MSTTPTSFPQEVELTIKFKFSASDQESLDYIKPTESGDVQSGVLADLFDILADSGTVELLSINGKTYKDLKKELSVAVLET
jgi:hypothetical protein